MKTFCLVVVVVVFAVPTIESYGWEEDSDTLLQRTCSWIIDKTCTELSCSVCEDGTTTDVPEYYCYLCGCTKTKVPSKRDNGLYRLKRSEAVSPPQGLIQPPPLPPGAPGRR